MCTKHETRNALLFGWYKQEYTLQCKMVARWYRQYAMERWKHLTTRYYVFTNKNSLDFGYIDSLLIVLFVLVWVGLSLFEGLEMLINTAHWIIIFSVTWVLDLLLHVDGKDVLSWKDYQLGASIPYDSFFKSWAPSVSRWENIDMKNHFSVLSMHIDHHFEANWYIPALHDKYSVGWNRTLFETHTGRRPYACTLRFLAVALESTLQGYVQGGSGYITLGFSRENRRMYWHGFDKNETNKLYCYYSTNKDTGSEFLDTPKSLGLAIMCPVPLNDEIGNYEFTKTMEDGRFCFPLAQYSVEVEIHLRKTIYSPFIPNSPEDELVADFVTSPAKHKHMDALVKSDKGEHRRHAVCTVLTFKNQFTGSMLYLFAAYYQLMGWRVIIYDRFGMHYAFVKELLSLPGIDYYPFTLYELAQPNKYNIQYLEKQGTDMKSFYKMEANWGYSSKKLADTADQDADKTRTYDYARLEYAHLDTMLFVDADELLFCPQAGSSISAQRDYHRHLHNEFQVRGLEEMRYVRLPYSGIAPPDFVNNQTMRSKTDFTNHTGHCMINAFEKRCLHCLVSCWSSATSFDNFPKSADLASMCPFHYNHWSCDGMKGGGRDFTKNRCRCKVGFDMQNGITYHPQVDRCHLMHFNDNKYRFQSNRQNHVHDQGDVTQPSPLSALLKDLETVTNYTEYALSQVHNQVTQVHHVFEKEIVIAKPHAHKGKGHIGNSGSHHGGSVARLSPAQLTQLQQLNHPHLRSRSSAHRSSQGHDNSDKGISVGALTNPFGGVLKS